MQYFLYIAWIFRGNYDRMKLYFYWEMVINAWRCFFLVSSSVAKDFAKEMVLMRLHDLLSLQKEVIQQFGESDYNVFIFGSFLTTRYEEGKSDVDIAIYTPNFALYKRLATYLEDYFFRKGIPSDIFFIDITMVAPIYCAPLKSEIQFTDYYPPELQNFQKLCQEKLEENRARVAG